MIVVMIATAKAVQIIHGNCRKEKRNFDLLAAMHARNHTCFGLDTGYRRNPSRETRDWTPDRSPG